MINGRLKKVLLYVFQLILWSFSKLFGEILGHFMSWDANNAAKPPTDPCLMIYLCKNLNLKCN